MPPIRPTVKNGRLSVSELPSSPREYRISMCLRRRSLSECSGHLNDISFITNSAEGGNGRCVQSRPDVGKRSMDASGHCVHSLLDGPCSLSIRAEVHWSHGCCPIPSEQLSGRHERRGRTMEVVQTVRSPPMRDRKQFSVATGNGHGRRPDIHCPCQLCTVIQNCGCSANCLFCTAVQLGPTVQAFQQKYGVKTPPPPAQP